MEERAHVLGAILDRENTRVRAIPTADQSRQSLYHHRSDTIASFDCCVDISCDPTRKSAASSHLKRGILCTVLAFVHDGNFWHASLHEMRIGAAAKCLFARRMFPDLDTDSGCQRVADVRFVSLVAISGSTSRHSGRSVLRYILCGVSRGDSADKAAQLLPSGPSICLCGLLSSRHSSYSKLWQSCS